MTDVADNDPWGKFQNPENYDLAVEHDKKLFFISADEYKDMIRQSENDFDKVGLFLDMRSINIQIIVALEDIYNGEQISFSQAKQYADILPTAEEVQEWEKSIAEINDYLAIFGGTPIEINTPHCTRTGVYGRIDFSNIWNTSLDKLTGIIRPTIQYHNPYLKEYAYDPETSDSYGIYKRLK